MNSGLADCVWKRVEAAVRGERSDKECKLMKCNGRALVRTRAHTLHSARINDADQEATNGRMPYNFCIDNSTIHFCSYTCSLPHYPLPSLPLYLSLSLSVSLYPPSRLLDVSPNYLFDFSSDFFHSFTQRTTTKSKMPLFSLGTEVAFSDPYCFHVVFFYQPI